VSPALPTIYSYDGGGRLVTVTPAGLTGMTLAYDGIGRLATIARANPTAIGGTQVTTVNYTPGVTGSSAPLTIDAGTATAWGQSQVENLPITATAVFGPDHVPAAAPSAADWAYASIAYINADGRATNSASYGSGAWQYGYTRYDQATGNVLLSLTPRNRREVLDPNYRGEDGYLKNATTPPSGQTLGDYRSNLAGSVNTYSPDGVDLLESLGPVHLMVRNDGTAQVEGRTHTVNTYDQAKPDPNIKYHLITTSVTGGQLVGGSPADVDNRTTLTDYTPIDGKPAADPTSGWTLRQPTRVTQKVTGGYLVHATRYDEDGRALESRMPRDPNTATAPSTSLTVYYRADSGNSDAACNRGDLAGWPCATAKGSNTATAGPAGALPALLTSRIGRYTRYAQPISASDGNGTVTRTTATDYDGAGRATHTATTGSAGTAVADQYLTRDPATGLVTCTSTATGCAGSTVTTGYDSLGRVVSSTDTDASTTTTGYDTSGRTVSTTESKGAAGFTAATNYTYDSSTEHRGLVTGTDSHLGSSPGTWTAGYDENGSLTSQSYPNGTIARYGYDETGYTVNKSYDFPNCAGCWYFNRSPNAFGQAVWTSDNTANPTYRYDEAGRLTSTYDQDVTTGASHVFKRRYSFDADSNRTALNTDDTSYSNLVRADGPAGYWRLDETTGSTAADSSANNRTGTCSGGWTPTNGGITPGETNRSTSFNGSTGTMSVPDAPDLRGNGGFAIAFAAKITADVASEWPTLVSKGDSSSPNGFLVYYDKTTHAVHYKRNNQDSYASRPGAITTAGWHSLAITYDATAQTLTFYIDGKPDRSYTGVTFPTNNGTTALTLAAGNYNANVGLDEVAVYTKALTADRVSYLWQAAAHGSYRQNHTYDEADRLTDPGYTYDGFGRTTTVPGRDAGGLGTQASGTRPDLTAGYYTTDLVASLTQAGTTKTYSLDPLRRTRVTTTSGSSTTTVQHYADSTAAGSEAASWVETTGSTPGWTRNISGPDGLLAATQDKTGTTTLLLTDLSDSVVGSQTDVTGSYPAGLIDDTEYGTPRPDPNGTPHTTAGPDTYSWLGGHRRDQDTLGDVTLMGQRLYNPVLGRFLQTDPVPGGSANDYDYANQDPVNGMDLSGQFGDDPGIPGVQASGAAITIVIGGLVSIFTKKALQGVSFPVPQLPNPLDHFNRTQPIGSPGAIPHPSPGPAPVPPLQVDATHRSNARPSSADKHAAGDSRRGRDAGNEKGDANRTQPAKRFGGKGQSKRNGGATGQRGSRGGY